MNEFIQISINLPNLLVSISKESECIKANLRFVLLHMIIDNPLLIIKKIEQLFVDDSYIYIGLSLKQL